MFPSPSFSPCSGAVAADGRIKSGDLILKVNEVDFAQLNNEEAVKVLREVVQQSGPVTLVVARPTYDPAEELDFNARGKGGERWVCREDSVCGLVTVNAQEEVWLNKWHMKELSVVIFKGVCFALY